MKKNFSINKKSLCLAGAAFLLAGSVTVGSAIAYFTTYATASGQAEVSLGFTKTVPNEKVSDWTKRIIVENTGDYDCYVRVKVFAGSKYQEGLEISGPDWTKGEDDYYYYKDVVPAGGATPGDPDDSKDPDVLRVKINHMESQEDFNVIVIQESTPVLYDESGNPYADWNVILDSVRDSYE